MQSLAERKRDDAVAELAEEKRKLAERYETMVVKNTFLEISDSGSLMGGFCRQMSEPTRKVSCWSRQISIQSQATLSEWDDWDDEPTMAGGRETPSVLLGPSRQCSSETPSGSTASYSTAATELLGHEPPRGVPQGAARPQAEQSPFKVPMPQPRPRGPPAGLSAHTVTMRGVPSKYTKQTIMGELQDAGFKHGRDFNFLYVPNAPRSPGDDTTSCFVNFTSATVMNAFCSAFDGRKMRQFNGSKPVQVTITTLEDLMLLSGGPSPAPITGSRPPLAAAPRAPAAAWPQGIPPAPAAVAPPVQISLQGAAPPPPPPLLTTAPPTTPPQAWSQLGTQPRSPPPPVPAPGWHLGQQQPAAALSVVFCPRCGTKGEVNFKFCSQCGFCVEGFRQQRGAAPRGTGR